MTDADLLPCPFCGASASVTQVNLAPGQSGESWDAWCAVCVVTLPDFPSRECAVAAWNRRAPHHDTALLDAVERGGWHVDCAPAGEPVRWTVCSWNASQNDFDEHSSPTLRAAIERAIEETK